MPRDTIEVEQRRSFPSVWMIAAAGAAAFAVIAAAVFWKLGTFQPQPPRDAGPEATFSFSGLNGSPKWYVSPWFEVRDDWQWSYEVQGRIWFLAVESKEEVLAGDANGPSGQNFRLAMRDYPDVATGVPPTSRWTLIRNRGSGALAVGGERRIRIYCDGEWKIRICNRPEG